MVLCCCAALVLCLGYHPPEPEYVFVPDTARKVGFYRRQVEYIGTLDADGNFREEVRIAIDQRGPIMHGTFTPIGKWGPAYEYRTGRLVKGVINSDGVFVPDPNAPVILFRDYRYDSAAIPIWNLPGYFMRREKLEERRRWLAEHAAEDPAYRAEKAKLDAAVAGQGGSK
jgi:hypothetical protein